MNRVTRKALGEELYIFLAFAVIVFRPGAEPPRHPRAKDDPSPPVPDDWTPDDYRLYIDEARLDMQGQQADKRDIRARAQIILTTALLFGGATVASFESKGAICACGSVLYAASGLLTTVAGLAAGGIISANSPIGAPNMTALPRSASGSVHRTLASGYASTRLVGRQTVAVLVTALRDSVLALILGVALLALAHIVV